jgi:hypothetical protein
MSEQDVSFDRYQRWRLILGKRVEEQMSALRCASGTEPGTPTLTTEQGEMDAALGAIYDVDETPPDAKTGKGGRRGAGLEKSRPRLAAWLGDVRKYFEQDVVKLIQQDAIERKGLKELLFEPETLSQITPSVELVGTLLALKGMIPEKTKETARTVIRAVVDEIVRRLAPEFERAVRGAIDRSRHQPIPSLPNLDWKRTISHNLKNYIPEKRMLIPERMYFHARQHRRKEWNVIVCMDQSGSMAESVVYGSVMGAIFASIPALESHVVVFDTEVVDLTEHCSDPVELLFGVQLGGGTDIARAVGYCQGLIHDPRKTLFILVTDLYEGGNARQLVQRLEDMVADGVRAVCLLALSDSGVPSYDERMATEIAAVGVPTFACTPKRLPEVLEAMLKGGSLAVLASRMDTTPRRATP